ncbi:DUF4870 domain-containing protein [Helcobacillus massiliensis]|uniref:Putative Tic20 family protein n=1 Tax=Helcobacillus massiliensis TaxID=521392 RepID=A0A839QS89_9MICO|nr:DUF4870 domain-containing protein [Helcobacillus massiliensis]MBB3022635.1 putative Tic20 family protein [Helcobacillus massiliensis]
MSSAIPPHNPNSPNPSQPDEYGYGQQGPHAQNSNEQHAGHGQQPHAQQAPYAHQPSAAQGAQAPLSDSDARLWAILAHLSMLIGSLASVGYLGWLGPLVILLVFGSRSPFVRQAAAGALNFAITIFIAQVVLGIIAAIGWILVWVLVGLIPLAIAGLGLVIVWVVSIIVPILAAVTANRGEAYRYPLTWHIIS